MYTLSVESHFDAAHRLSNYEGKCQRLHGHRWLVKIKVRGGVLNNWGAVVDFGDIKKVLNKELDLLDHRTILDTNDPQNHNLNLPEDWVVWFEGNPTAENIAQYLFVSLQPEIENLGVELKEVGVFESPESAVTYP